jgi:hypothetical protein
MTTELVSLHAFCRDNDLAKTSVRRWLNEQGSRRRDRAVLPLLNLNPPNPRHPRPPEA